MPIRDMVEINEDLCDGCGDCVTACAEGAIAIIDGKAKLVSEVYCDGLGACLGHCPQGAITVVRREAAAFDEAAVAERLAKLDAAGAAGPRPMMQVVAQAPVGAGCPGSRPRMMRPSAPADPGAASPSSQLRHWPVQLHLVPPTATFFPPDAPRRPFPRDCLPEARQPPGDLSPETGVDDRRRRNPLASGDGDGGPLLRRPRSSRRGSGPPRPTLGAGGMHGGRDLGPGPQRVPHRRLIQSGQRDHHRRFAVTGRSRSSGRFGCLVCIAVAFGSPCS
jgi:NAD-dependent dihydropyrimidine dehydrogenase PreA subunit